MQDMPIYTVYISIFDLSGTLLSTNLPIVRPSALFAWRSPSHTKLAGIKVHWCTLSVEGPAFFNCPTRLFTPLSSMCACLLARRIAS